MATVAERVPEPTDPPALSGDAASVTSLASRRPAGARADGEQSTVSQSAGLFRLTQLVWSAEDPETVAAETLGLLASVVPYAAASISAWNPLERHHRTIANIGYAEPFIAQLDNWLVEHDQGDTLIVGRDRHPRCRPDMSLDHVRTCLRATGLDEGVLIRLYAADGRYTGALHFHPRTRHRADTALDALCVIRTVLAAIIDWSRGPSTIAGAVEAGAAAAVVGGDGGVVALPGRSPGAHLGRGSRLVHAVAELLNAPTGRSRFLWQDELGRWHRVRVERLSEGALVFEREIPVPHQLTCRELDVLTLLTAGHSNREIAGLLIVALKTVTAHVEHILDKLGCASRTAAAALAVDEGLLRYPLFLPGRRTWEPHDGSLDR